MGGGDKESGYYLLMSHLLCEGFFSGPECPSTLLLSLDDRSSAYSLSRFRAELNQDLAHRGIGTKVARTIEPIDSHQSTLLQMGDVLMGALSYLWNGDQLKPSASQAKVWIARRIAERAHLDSLLSVTVSHAAFGIWKYPLSHRK